MISGRFLKSSLIYTIGGAMPMASGLILLPFYTDMLDESMYGVLMLYIAFGLIMQVLTTYALDSYLGVHYIDVAHDKTAARKLIGAVTGLLLTLGLVIIPIAGLVGAPVFNVAYNTAGNLDYYPWGFMSVAIGFFNGFFKAATNLTIFRQEPIRFLWFNVANFILTITISLAGLYMYPGELIGPMWGRLLSAAGIFILALWFLVSEYGISFRFSNIKGLHKFCFPFMIYLVLVWIVANVDRLIINDTMDPERVGLYDFAVRCTLLIDLLQNGLIAAVNPVVFTIWKESGRNESTAESNRYFNVYTAAGILFCAGFSFIVPLCLPIVVDNESYYVSFAFMGAVASGFALRGVYHYFLSPLLYLKKTKLLPVAFACCAALQIPLTIWLARSYEVNGVVWASIIVKGLQALFLYLLVRNHFRFSFNSFKLVVLPLAYVSVCVTLWIYLDRFDWRWYGALFILTSLTLFLLYRKEIIQTLQSFRKKRNPAT